MINIIITAYSRLHRRRRRRRDHGRHEGVYFACARCQNLFHSSSPPRVGSMSLTS